MYWTEPDQILKNVLSHTKIFKVHVLAVFNNGATMQGNETIINFYACLGHITNHVFPARLLQMQK